ncbi:hypothetical protein Q5752_006168 [Cryptotrichosporon argae]
MLQRPPLLSAHASLDAVPRRLDAQTVAPHLGYNVAPAAMYLPRRDSGDSDLGTDGSSLLQGMHGALAAHRTSSGSSDDVPRRADITNGWGGLKRGQACAFCRRRKLRCSGERPACTSCVKYHKSCEYAPVPPDVAQRRPSAEQVPISHLASKGPPIAPILVGLPPGVRQSHPQRIPSQPFPGAPLASPYTPVTSGYSSDSRVRLHSYPGTHMNNQLSTFGGPLLSPADMTAYKPGPASIGHVDVGLYQQMPAPDMGVFATPGAVDSYKGPPQWTPTLDVSSALDPATLSHLDPYPGYSTTTEALSTSIRNTAPDVSLATATRSVMPMAPPSSYPPAPTQPDLPYIASMPELSTNTGPSRKASLIQTPNESPYSSNLSQPTPEASAGSNTPSCVVVQAPAIKNMYRETPALHYVRDAGSLEGLTERLGEFLFSPTESAVKEESAWAKRKQADGRKPAKQSRGADNEPNMDKALQFVPVSSRLPGEMRAILLDCFLMHSSMFFQMNIPRFRHRMSFTDRRSPSPALLNAMYLWATRMSNSPRSSSMEADFFHDACRFLDASTSTVDRLIDAIRAAMLLAAYSYSSGRHHEGWCLAGVAVRLVLSCGLHRIKSIVFAPDAGKQNPFLRNHVFLLPPPEDAIELGDRIHAFWAVFAIDRCGALATGYPSGFTDADITTPFPKDVTDIASNNVTHQDDFTVSHMFRGVQVGPNTDIHYTSWVKSVTVLERASKLLFRDPEPDSPYQVAWDHYHQAVLHDPSTPPPSPHLEQPRYRVPRAYEEAWRGLAHLIASMGDNGVFPVERRRQAEQAGLPEVEISYNVIMLHHLIAAIEMVLHDVNNMEAENADALAGARKSVALFRHLPQLPFTDVDAFQVLVWSMIAKVLIKEVHRLNLVYDTVGALAASQDADVIIDEMTRIGQTMHLARTQAKAVRELKQASFDSVLSGGTGELPLYKDFDFNFMYPQPTLEVPLMEGLI